MISSASLERYPIETTSLPLSIDPDEAARLQASGGAVLIDIRTIEERKQGYPLGSIHIAWQVGPALLKNPRFVREVLAKAGDRTALLICRSGRRSLDAARVLRQAGLSRAFDVAEGCDGVDGASPPSGWKARHLPWADGP